MSTGKRVRIDPNATTGTSKKQPTAPLTTALNLIRTTAASLQPTLADIFTQHASQYVNQLANLANKVKQLADETEQQEKSREDILQFKEIKCVLLNLSFNDNGKKTLNTDIIENVMDELRRERKPAMVLADEDIEEYILLDLVEGEA